MDEPKKENLLAKAYELYEQKKNFSKPIIYNELSKTTINKSASYGLE
jgi:hypothetical protein